MRKLGIVLLFLSAFGLTSVDAQSQFTKAREEPVRAVIKAFADARNAHDGPAVAALYSDDGEWIDEWGHPVRGRAALLTMWSAVTGHVDRTIWSIEFPAPSIAVVRVITQYEEPIGKHSEVFILIRQNAETGKHPENWKIRIHQSIVYPNFD